LKTEEVFGVRFEHQLLNIHHFKDGSKTK